MAMRLLERLERDLSPQTDGIENVMAVMLRHCREHVGVLRRAYSDPTALGAMHDLADKVAQFVKEEFDDVALEPNDVCAIVAEATRRVAEVEPPFGADMGDAIAARGFANGLDRQLGPRVASRYRHRGVLRIAKGDAFPVARPPLKEIFGKDIGTLPDSRGPALDECRNLRILAEPQRGLEVELDTGQIDALANFQADSNTAVVWTTTLAQLDWDFEERAGQCWFHSVRPLDRAARVQDAKEQLAVAQAAGCAVVILPEMSLDPGGVDDIIQWSKENGHPFSLLVLGSAHVTGAGGTHTNVSTTLLPNGSRVEHSKWNPFEIPLPRKDTSELAPHRELITASSPRVRLVLAGAWSFVVLVCKDFLDAGVVTLLEDLRARLVLVPARSPKTADFESGAQQLAAAAQAVVVVANAWESGNPDPAAAIVARPLRAHLLEVFPSALAESSKLQMFRLRG
jgi:predicted amidohydrolase